MKGIKIKNYSNYWIFPTLGMIWSNPRRGSKGGWVNTYENRYGYYRVALYDDDGKKHCLQLHRVIYEAVNGEIQENMQVNHINEDKSLNSIWNLNLMTPKENTNWGTCIQRRSEKRRGRPNPKVTEKLKNNPQRSHKVAAFKNGVLIMTFPSTMEANRQGFDAPNVQRCCKGKQLAYKGYQWKYMS